MWSMSSFVYDHDHYDHDDHDDHDHYHHNMSSFRTSSKIMNIKLPAVLMWTEGNGIRPISTKKVNKQSHK